MVTVYRVSAIWSGFLGAPGYSRFAVANLTDTASLNAAGESLRVFFDAIKAMIPNGTSILVQPQVDGYDMATGELVSSSSMTTAPATVTSAQTAQPYASGSGMFVSWNTSVIFNGHRVKGRTFLVPIVGSYFENDGSPLGVAVSNVQTAGNALATGNANFSVWSRLYSKTPPITQIGGALAPVVSCTVKDVASGLRSRRP
jgi:hypothetical protein